MPLSNVCCCQMFSCLCALPGVLLLHKDVIHPHFSFLLMECDCYNWLFNPLLLVSCTEENFRSCLVLSFMYLFIHSRIVKRFASCVGVRHLLDSVLAGTQNQGIYHFPTAS